MAKLKMKKMKKLGTQSHRDAQRAEVAAERAEAALRRVTALTQQNPETSTSRSTGMNGAPDTARAESGTARPPIYASPRAQEFDAESTTIR